MQSHNKQGLKDIFIITAKPFILILLLVIIGTIGYEIVEGWNFIDSLYMSIISLTTVGYGTPYNLSYDGKLFTCIYLLFSVVIFLYLASEFARRVISINFTEFFSKRQMDTRIKNLNNHYVICGFGRTGRAIATQLSLEKLDFIVIDKNVEALKDARDFNYLSILGDATTDETLVKAHLGVSKGLFAALSEDAENLFVAISAKSINPDLNIVVRCSKSGNEDKFKKAGVDNVISPFTISALRMVSSLVRPLVADFLEEVMNTKLGLQLRMEQFYIPDNSDICNKSILNSEIRPQSGVFILAIQRDSDLIHNPTAETIIKAKDHLIVLGSTDQLLKLESMIQQKGSTLT